MEIVQPGIGSGTVVDTINGLSGDIILAAGSNITITPSGNTLTIAASGGGASIGGAVTGGTAGSVLFVNPDGILAQDNANFFYKVSTGMLGFGTTNPQYDLDISKSAGSGVTTHIQNSSSSSFSRIFLGTDASAGKLGIYSFGSGYASSGQNQANKSLIESLGDLYINPSGGNTLFYSGNVAINSLTASKVVFTDSSKNLTSTGIGTSSQFIKGDGSLDSTTYGTGTVTGTGAAGQVSFWTGSTAQSGDNAFWWDNTNKRFGVGTVTPSSAIDITTNTLGTTQTTTSGLALVNTTASTVSQNQISPALRSSATGWKTTATAASQKIDWYQYAVGMTGTTKPLTGYNFDFSVNSGSFATAMSIQAADSASQYNNSLFIGTSNRIVSTGYSNLQDNIVQIGDNVSTSDFNHSPSFAVFTNQTGTGQLVGRFIGVNSNLGSSEKRIAQISFLTGTATNSGSVSISTTKNGSFRTVSDFRVTEDGYAVVGSDTATSKLQLESDALATTPDDTKSLLLRNGTAATSSVQQYSPALILEGQGWNTGSSATAADRFRLYNQTGLTNTNSSSLLFQKSFNGGAYSTYLAISSVQVSGNGTQDLNGFSSATITGNIQVLGGTMSVLKNTSNTSTDSYLSLTNTAATSGSPSIWSPRSRWTGAGWNTTTTTSQSLDFILENKVTGGTNPITGQLTWSSQIAGGGYNAIMTLTDTGLLGIGTTSPTSKLDIENDALGSTITGTSGLTIKNTTAATSGAQSQNPGVIALKGFAWNGVASASQNSDLFLYSTVGPANTPLPVFNIAYASNGSAITSPIFTVSANSGTFTGNGSFDFSSANVVAQRYNLNTASSGAYNASMSADGFGATSNRFNLVNTNVATVGNQAWSPAIHWQGQGWKTTATAAAQLVDFRNYLVPVQGATNPSSTLNWDASINGGAFSNVMQLTSAGNLVASGATATFRLKSYTVATLPTGVQGDTAYVTDALAPTFLSIVVGGGSVVSPVFYNGTNWVGY